jgi:GNAT superfamily N-acetyltransferase
VSAAADDPELILVWPRGREVPRPAPVAGYTVTPLPAAEDTAWIEIHRRAVPAFRERDLETWLARYRGLALPEGILVAMDATTREPVATAGSLVDPEKGVFPGAGQLGWVATVPEHRRKGLAGWLCALTTLRLREEGFRRIFLSSGEDMPAALGVYLRLGYVPCLHSPGEQDRWDRICRDLGAPLEPDRWPTRQEYLAG